MASRFRSIRSRLLVGISLALALLLGMAAWCSYYVAKHESEELFGARLATSARVLEGLVARQVEHATITKPLVITLPDEIDQTNDDRGTPLGHPYETKIAFQVWRDGGTLLVRSASAPDKAFAANASGFTKQRVDGAAYHVFVLKSGSTWIQVAENVEVRDELLDNLGLAVMSPLFVGALVLLVVANLVVLYGLEPLRALASSIEGRAPDMLAPLDVDRVPDEAQPVVRALNGLFHRVRDALERERRFTDAAAHELRTPLAALRIHADNVARATSDEERMQSMRRLRQGLERASKLAGQMLAYSRTQDDREREERVPIRFADLLGEAIAQLEPLRERKRQSVDLHVSVSAEQAHITGEPTKMRRLVINLLDNASRYSPEGSVIEVGLQTDGQSLDCTIANPGAAIPPDLRERVFEPYYRIPGSGSDGSGLGLAIVKEIAEQHGAAIALSARAGDEGTRIRITFPLLAR